MNTFDIFVIKNMRLLIKNKLETVTTILVNIWVVLMTSNTKFYYEKKLNVFFHNLRGHDSHFHIQEIEKFNRKISVIPNNTKKL